MEEQISKWAKKVLDHIAARAQGGIWEGTRGEVAKALGCSESTVKRALHELKRAGYLEVIAPGGGRGKPTRYWANRAATLLEKQGNAEGATCESTAHTPRTQPESPGVGGRWLWNTLVMYSTSPLGDALLHCCQGGKTW
jgi:DNA-binding transcriptional MocR family regulator